MGDFAMSGSDPVNRADMALLIARLLVCGDQRRVDTVNVNERRPTARSRSVGVAASGLGLLR